MSDSITDDSSDELINGDGWLAALSLSIITFIAIFVVGVLILPNDDNAISLLVIVGLAVASKILVSGFPHVLSFRQPSLRTLTIAVIAAFGMHAVLWGRPLAEGYLNHYYSYKLFGRIIYAILLCTAFPIAEEIYFRGLIFPIVSLRFGLKSGAILSLIMFIIYHMTSNGVLSLALLGGVSTWLVIRAKSVIPSIVLHIIYNSIWLIQGVTTLQK